MEPKVPSKEEFDKMTPAQKAARKREAMMQNLNLSPEEKKAKKAMQNKPAKKMMAGGMAKKYKAGGKVRGYGMARGGKVCKMR